MGLLKRSRSDDATRARVAEALERLRTLLPLDDCQVELVAFREGVAELRIAGGCPHCEMDAKSLTHGIEAHVKQSVAEVREVRIEGTLSLSRDDKA